MENNLEKVTEKFIKDIYSLVSNISSSGESFYFKDDMALSIYKDSDATKIVVRKS